MNDDMTPPRAPSAITSPSEYGRHLAAVAQAPSAEQLLDAVRHAVLCAEVHGDRVSPWWRGVVDAYRELVPEVEQCGATP